MTPRDVTSLAPPLVTNRARRILFGAALLGVGSLLVGFLIDGARSWSVLLVNFLFWSGVGHAGIVLSAVFQVTSARWARPIKRVAEASIAFLPISAVLLIVVLAGVPLWAPWMRDPVEGREAWLNAPFLIARQTLGFLLLGVLSVKYAYWSIRPDLGLLHESGQPVWQDLAHYGLTDWRGLEAERAISQRRQSRLAPAILIVYATVLSLQAFDFVMSLDRQWFSTLVGGYFFIGNLYVGLAGLALMVVWIRSRAGLSEYVRSGQLYDVGRMLFAFCMLWAYLFWSQYLVIWYGDLPEETAFVARRTVEAPWAPLSWLVFVGSFVLPFVVLLSRKVKSTPRGLAAVASVVFVGMWLERFVLVAPSIRTAEGLPIGPLEILVTIGFGAVFVLSYTWWLERVPIVPVADPLLLTPSAHGHPQETGVRRQEAEHGSQAETFFSWPRASGARFNNA
jgi:hypothetical protein